MSEQYGFDMNTGAFDFGRGQAGFDWSQPESASERETRERRKRNAEEEWQREKRRREQKQKADRDREEEARRAQEESRRQREYSGGRSRCQFSWEACHEILGVPVGADAKTIRAAWAAKMRTAHPDAGGDPELAKRLNAAYNQLKREARRA